MFIFLLVIQIITESLPISSSGHIALLQYFSPNYNYGEVALEPFLWLVHGITACFMLYIMRSYWIVFLRHPWRTRRLLVRVFLYGLCAEIMTVILYGTLHTYVQGKVYLVIGCAITMLALLSLMFCRQAQHYNPLYVWILTGVVQGFAVIPGCSRMALTYVTARWLGYSGRHALMLSFTLALPMFTAASLYGAHTIMHTSCLRDMITLSLVIAIILSSIIAYVTLLITCHLMIKERLYYVGWYMICVLLLVSR